MSPSAAAAAAAGPTTRGFSPYTDNGGTTLAIAGEDFCLVASDTRQSQGYSINTRYAPKVFPMPNGSVVGTGGMYSDTVALMKRIEQRLEWYRFQHDKPMSTSALAQMLSTILYHKRFFPYYVWNTVCGFDENGKGVVYTYDAVGTYQGREWECTGTAAQLLLPFIDNQIGKHHMTGVAKTRPSMETAIRITKDAFTSATERDIYTGDTLEIFIITKDGYKKESFPLKRD